MGVKELVIKGIRYTYKGQLDENNLATGIGYIYDDPSEEGHRTYEGAFLNDKLEGIGVENTDNSFEGEYKENY